MMLPLVSQPARYKLSEDHAVSLMSGVKSISVLSASVGTCSNVCAVSPLDVCKTINSVRSPHAKYLPLGEKEMVATSPGVCTKEVGHLDPKMEGMTSLDANPLTMLYPLFI